METRQAKGVANLHDNSLKNEAQVDADKSEDETSDNELSDMDKLPNEILIEILSYFDEQELVKYRLLNSRWNEICCVLLQDKTKNNRHSSLIVKLQTSRREETFHCCTTGKKAFFGTFLKCFSPPKSEKSSDAQIHRQRPCPFSRFFVKDLCYLKKSQITRFVSTFGPHMKFITLDIEQQDCKNFEILWKLLLEFAPNIQHLGIGGDYWLNKLNLFDSTKNVNKQSESFLQYLKSIEITRNQGFGNFDAFIKDLLNHTPNVKEISFWDLQNWQFSKSNELKDLEWLQKCGKPHLLKKLDIQPDAQSDLLPLDLMKNLRLEDLEADCFFSSNSVENEKSSTSYIYHALKSSPNTLFKLDLYNLSAESMNHCFKGIKSLPNVRQLKIQIQNDLETGSILDRLSQICPNITNLELGWLQVDFSQVARVLWTGFTGLKSLQFKLYTTNGQNNNLLAMDSVFFGYSKESIKRIEAKLDEGISLEKAREEEEQSPSILDLKDLSRLEFCFYPGEETEEIEMMENQLRNSVFMKILPQHIRENPTSIIYCDCFQF